MRKNVSSSQSFLVFTLKTHIKVTLKTKVNLFQGRCFV